MIIEERKEGYLNFFTSAILVVLGITLLNVVVMPLVIIDLLWPILSPDSTIAALQMNLFGQIVATIIILFFLIPFFKVKKAKYKFPTIGRTLKTIAIAFIAFTLAFFIGLGLVLFFETVGLPVESSYGFLLPTPEHLANPWNIVLFFVTVTFGAAIFEELIYRRMLIPTLEIRGMAPTAAVIASSLGFAVIHLPNDLMNGTLGYVFTHFITTFTIGVFMGLVYITTRNVIFPMIIHGFINFIAFSEYVIFILNDFYLMMIYALIVLAIWIIGFIAGIFLLFQYLKDPPAPWAATLKSRSKINILPGLIGFLIFAFGVILLQVILEAVIVVALYPIVLTIYIVIFLVYLAFFLVLLWLETRTRFDAPPELEPESWQQKIDE